MLVKVCNSQCIVCIVGWLRAYPVLHGSPYVQFGVLWPRYVTVRDNFTYQDPKRPPKKMLI